MKRPDITKLKKAVLSGKRLSEICREGGFDVNTIRRVLKKEGIDYRQIFTQRKERQYEIEFEQCLKLARKNGLIPTGAEFKSIGMPKSRTSLYVKKLKAMGFMQKFINHSKINDEKLLKELYKIYKKTGAIPENRHVIMYSKYSNTSYYNHFGSLANAVNRMLEVYVDPKKKLQVSQ